nr:type II toxin-antitoxin system HicA family toxin [Spirulina subsalsa]
MGATRFLGWGLEWGCCCGIGAMKVKDIIKILENDGWYHVRTRGSHRQFRHLTKSGTVTISGKLNVDMPPGTLNNVLKQAGLK